MGNSSSSSPPNHDNSNNSSQQLALLAPPQNGNTSKNASTFSVFSVNNGANETKSFLICGYSDGTLALYELNSASSTILPRAFTKISQSQIVAIDQMIVSSPSSPVTGENAKNFFFVCLSRQPPQLVFVKLEMEPSANSCCNYSFSTIPSSHVSLFSLCQSNNFLNATRFSSCMSVVHGDASSISVVVGGDDGSVCCVGQEEESFCPTVKLFSDPVVGILPLLQASVSSHFLISFVGVAKNSEKVVVFDFVDRSHRNDEEIKDATTATSRKKTSSEISVRQELQVPGMTDVVGICLLKGTAANNKVLIIIISSHELFVISIRSEDSFMQIASRIPLVARKNEIVTSCCSSVAEENVVFVVTNRGELLRISLESTLKIENLSQSKDKKTIPSNGVSSICQRGKNLFFFIETGSGFVSSFKMNDVEAITGNISAKIQTASVRSDDRPEKHQKSSLPNVTTTPARNSNITNQKGILVDNQSDDLSIQHSFDFFDFDGSGFLEKTEALAAFAHLMQKKNQLANSSPTRRARAAREIFDESDWNKDGKISFAEFKKAMLKI